MPLEGRGSAYTPTRHALEWTLSHLYRGSWPARLAKAMHLQGHVRCERHVLRIDDWPAHAPKIRLGFASDLHVGPTTHPALIEEAAQHLEDAAIDVLLLGGDYVYLRSDGIEELAERFGRIPARARFAVLGNHDLWSRETRVVAALERAGFEVLVNRAVMLPAPFAHVSICGLDEPWTGSPDRAQTFAGAAPIRVLLMHAPSGLLFVDDEPFALAICGHTHGGHIALPGGIPIVNVDPLGRRYPHGEHTIDPGRTIIVSRGVGGTESPVRIFADPDVRIVDLIPAG